MSSLSEAKQSLQFNRDFRGLVDVLKGIAASQFQNLMRKRQRFEPFAAAFDGFFRMIDLARIDSPFVRRESDVTGVVMATSDEGFMGDLNAKVVNASLEEAGPGKKEIYVLGSRGYDLLKERDLDAIPFPAVNYEKRFEEATALKDRLVADVAAQKIGRLTVTYPHPVSFTVQRPVVVKLLPAAELFQKEEEGGVEETKLAPIRSPVILESKSEAIVEYLVGIWIARRLTDLFEEGKIAEYAAKTIHLEQSHDRLVEQEKILRYRYFRSRRELIDKGTRETFASILLRRHLEDE